MHNDGVSFPYFGLLGGVRGDSRFDLHLLFLGWMAVALLKRRMNTHITVQPHVIYRRSS